MATYVTYGTGNCWLVLGREPLAGLWKEPDGNHWLASTRVWKKASGGILSS